MMNSKNNDIIKFKNDMKEIQEKLNSNNLLNSVFVTDKNKIGYTKVCDECNYLEMIDTNIEIPFDDLKDKEFKGIILSFSNVFTTKTNLLYNDDCLCHCGSDEYELVDNEWVYIGDIIDLDC